MAPSAPEKREGRPRNAWTSPRRKLLVRLYALTNLDNSEIQKVLATQGFSPKRRDIQTQLHALFSADYSKEWRAYRPKNFDDMVTRNTIIEASRQHRIFKIKRCTEPRRGFINSAHRSRSLSNGLCFKPEAAFQDFSGPESPPRLVALADSQPTNSWELMLDGSSPASLSGDQQIDSKSGTGQMIQEQLKSNVTRTKHQAQINLVDPNGASRTNNQDGATNYINPQKLQPFRPKRPVNFTIAVPSPVNATSVYSPPTNGSLTESLRTQDSETGNQQTSINNHEISEPLLESNSTMATFDLSSETRFEEEMEIIMASSPPADQVGRAFEDGVHLTGVATEISDTIWYSNLSMTVAADPPASKAMVPNSKASSVLSRESLAHRLAGLSAPKLEHVLSASRSRENLSSSVSLISICSVLSSSMSICSILSKSSSTTHSLHISQPLLENSPPTTSTTTTVKTLHAKTGESHRTVEQVMWDEIIDQVQLIPAPDCRPVYREISLTNRPCCSLTTDGYSSCPECGFSAVHALAKCGVLPIFSFANGSQLLNEEDYFGNSPLHFAAASGGGGSAYLLALIDNGANIFAKNTSNQTFLHVLKLAGTASEMESNGSRGYYSLLIRVREQGFHFEDRDCHGRTVAHAAVSDFYSAILEHNFLNEKLSMLLDNHGHTPKHERGQHTKDDLDRSLPQIENFRHTVSSIIENPIFIGCGTVTREITLDYVSRIDVNGNTPLIALIKSWEGPKKKLKEHILRLISMGTFVDMRDRKGRTALTISVLRGCRSCAKVLLNAGASPNNRDYEGKGILYRAIRRMDREKRDKEYARIMGCAMLVIDHGAKAAPTERDEALLRSVRHIDATSISVPASEVERFQFEFSGHN